MLSASVLLTDWQIRLVWSDYKT